MKFARPAALLLLAPAVALAQAPAPAPAKDAIRNGGFERTLQTPNLWAGVDKDGVLCGFRGYLPVMNERGQIADALLPASAAVTDLNNDSLPDLVAADCLGYVRYYLNCGSKEQPKFGAGVLTSPYLALNDWAPAPDVPNGNSGDRQLLWAKRRTGLRISLAALGDAKPALVAGNYFGDIILTRQSGSSPQALFAQPDSLQKVILELSKEADRHWGNVFAPVIHDWDGDGKSDLLVGEGSYSANNVHLFLNEGSNASPAFKMENRSILALGEGRQHLTPAVFDLDGDGKLDLLVSDSRGTITAYLRPAAWKKGESMKPSGYLSKSGGLTNDEKQAVSLGSGIHTIASADLNSDGLIDLVVGKPDGRIAWMPNRGTKQQPKFENPSMLAGEKPSPASWLLPSQWDLDMGDSRGNFFAYASCLSAQEDPAVDAKEGTRALKFGYTSGAGSPLASMSFPGSKTFKFAEYKQTDSFYNISLGQRLLGAPSRTFMLQQQVQLEVGKPYTFSFQHKGSSVVRANAFLGWWGFKVLGEDKVSRGARGATKVSYNHANEHDKLSKDFKPSTSWGNFSEKFTVKFTNNDLKDEKTTFKAVLIIAFELAAPNGVLYLDDIKIAPAPQG